MALEFRQVRGAAGGVFHEQGGVVPDRQVLHDGGRSLECLAHLQGQGIHQLNGGGSGSDEGGQGRVGGLQVREHQQARGRVLEARDGAETASATKPRVPSLPMIQWAMMSTGVRKSNREFSP